MALLGEICKVQRKIAFANPLLKGIDKLLFVKRDQTSNHICDQYFGNKQRPGGSLYVLSDPFGTEPKVKFYLGTSASTATGANEKLARLRAEISSRQA